MRHCKQALATSHCVSIITAMCVCVCTAVHKLDEQTSAALQAASHLEELLAQDVPAHMMGAWSIRERIEPLLQVF